jgi:DNA polymerase-1
MMNDQPTSACIDGDLMCFKAACSLDKHGIENLEERLTQDLGLWDPGVGEVTVAFSTGRRNNYRRDFWPSYKAHRDGKAGPESLQDVIQWVKDNHNGPIDVRPRIEADDIMGIHMSEGNATCVTKDKDLRSVPGWFWDPERGFPELVTEDEADHNHHYQWLIGDSADNIPGIYRFGPKAALKFLEGIPFGKRSEAVMNHYIDCQYDTVKWKSKDGTKMSGTRAEQLEDKYGWEGGHDEVYALSQARCVRILRAGEWDYETETPILWSP